MPPRSEPPEPLAAGYSGWLGRRLLWVRRLGRRLRGRCRRLFRRRVGSTRTFPPDPTDMRLAYGYRRLLLGTVACLLLARLATRVFAMELFRDHIAWTATTVLAFNVGVSLAGLCGFLAARCCWRWSRRAAVRFGAPIDAVTESRRL
jgi:hypothetical protein